MVNPVPVKHLKLGAKHFCMPKEEQTFSVQKVSVQRNNIQQRFVEGKVLPVL
jgi:hypothetical protein